MKNNKFDAVKFMRDRRDELSGIYLTNPKKIEKDLERINQKYNLIKKGKLAGKYRIKRKSSV